MLDVLEAPITKPRASDWSRYCRGNSARWHFVSPPVPYTGLVPRSSPLRLM